MEGNMGGSSMLVAAVTQQTTPWADSREDLLTRPTEKILWDAVQIQRERADAAEDEVARLKDMLEKIAKYPTTPEIIKQYARGDLDGH